MTKAQRKADFLGFTHYNGKSHSGQVSVSQDEQEAKAEKDRAVSKTMAAGACTKNWSGHVQKLKKSRADTTNCMGYTGIGLPEEILQLCKIRTVKRHNPVG